ncbi:hypothetical protein [Paractinoplanes toevensis]|uniref:Uncharacterized protein n=1 Tax=Paractinoplanes toevensis TaxID=571911 RepID=A0A919TDL8_9ACTN|nr:hypothetical protein [Actinoplanes toevensis]GIM92234.1 hypothetical protein Ato02nite_040270 [Actinoplanes toevensis]
MRAWWELARVVAVIALLVALLALTKGVIILLGDRFPVPTLIGMIVAFLTPPAVILINRERARRRMRNWAATGEWTPVAPDARTWPWQDLLRQGRVRVRRAWTREVDGFPVVAGELHWTGNALAGAVTGDKGRGVFVVVRLPLTVPSMALRPPSGFVGDSFRLDRPELRAAYVAGELPAWTARGDELFTVEQRHGWVWPETTEAAIRRALRTVTLLDLGPDLTS